jgi:hypothetical protein
MNLGEAHYSEEPLKVTNLTNQLKEVRIVIIVRNLKILKLNPLMIIHILYIKMKEIQVELACPYAFPKYASLSRYVFLHVHFGYSTSVTCCYLYL